MFSLLIIESTIHASELSQVPYKLTISLYENQNDIDPVTMQTYYPEEWTSNIDLSDGIPNSDELIRFNMQFDRIDQLETGKPLWVETRIDGKKTGERISLKVLI